MKILSVLYDIVCTTFMGFFELLFAGIILVICILIPIVLSYAVVNNGNHIMDPSVALVIGAGLITIISKEW
jgi:hypothetical protein